jgi:hypothetical protein
MTNILVERLSTILCSQMAAVTLLVLHCHAHALLLTIVKVNIVTTSLKVTLRKLVMTQVFCGTRRAAIADW